MKRYIALCLVFVLTVALLGDFGSAQAAGEILPHPLAGKTVLIDAGHGGIDAGAVGWVLGTREDELNLAIAQKLQKLLEEAGVTVQMTRENDGGLYDEDTASGEQKRQDMQRRAQMIRESNADYVISIHMNCFTSSDAFGAQVLYQTGSEDGQILAEIIQQEFLTGLDDGNRRVAASGDYMVLRNANVPAVLIECGFLSNEREEALLCDETYQQRIAWHIYCGLMRYAASVAQ